MRKYPHTANPDFYNTVYLDLMHNTDRTLILYGGRDSGKSDFIAQALLLECLQPQPKYFKCILIRNVYNTIKESQWQTLKDVAEYMGLSSEFRFLKNPLEVICKSNGKRFIARGCDDVGKLKSVKDPTHVWIEEADQIREEDYDTISLSLRNSKGVKGQEWLSFNSGSPHNWIAKEFFPRKRIGKEYVFDNSFEKPDGSHLYVNSTMPGTTILHTSYLNNEFITDDRIERHEALKAKNPHKYNINSLGLFGVDVPGALWDWDMIQYVDEMPELRRVAVAIDPSASNTHDSDEAGIVAAGIGYDGLIYVIDDWSGIMGPNDWAKRALALYNETDADYIVAEKNQGGDMIKSVFQAIKSPILPQLVHASRGKRTRAEPVAALYADGQVFHCKQLKQLENEMTTWDATGNALSPNRIDALVWAITSLKLKPKRRAKIIRQ